MGMEKPLDLYRPPSARLTGMLSGTSSRPGSAGLASARTNTAPDLEQTMACRDVETRKSRDRERFRKRTANRRARGLCLRCGVRPPANGLSACESCAEKRRLAERARDARLRAEGKPRRDPSKERISKRRRYRVKTAERAARGLCPKCGKEPIEAGRRLCAPCGEKRRASDRARYAAGKQAGKLYGGRDIEQRRKAARERSRQRLRKRLEAGLCTRCGRRPPTEGGTTCNPCRESRREREKQQWSERRSAGECGKCGAPVPGWGSRCERCLRRETSPAARKAKNARSRKRYVKRRLRHLCTDCGGPAMDACRCPPCARRSWARSAEHRGLPDGPPLFTVIEIATGENHGTYDSLADVVLCLAFAKLSHDDVEVIQHAGSMSTLTGWE